MFFYLSGFVLQITDSKLVISLPGGFTGIVQYKEISDTVYSLLKEVGDDTDKVITNSISSVTEKNILVCRRLL